MTIVYPNVGANIVNIPIEASGHSVSDKGLIQHGCQMIGICNQSIDDVGIKNQMFYVKPHQKTDYIIKKTTPCAWVIKNLEN